MIGFRQRPYLLAFALILGFASISSRALANTDTQFRLSSRGAALLQTEGKSAAAGTGFAVIQMEPASFNPAGVAIFRLRQNGVLVTEAAVPAAIPSTSGRIYAEIGDGVDTGLAIANPNNEPA